LFGVILGEPSASRFLEILLSSAKTNRPRLRIRYAEIRNVFNGSVAPDKTAGVVSKALKTIIVT